MKLLTKAEGIMSSDDVSPESISKEDRETIDLTQIVTKKFNLEELDQTILAAITAEQELESEVAYSLQLDSHAKEVSY